MTIWAARRDGLLCKVIGAAYSAAGYGAGFDQLSSISFLRFVHGDRRGKCAQVGSANGIAASVVPT